jgi:hypothetical protein
MSQGGNDSTGLGKVVLVLVAACVIAFVIANAKGKKDACLAEGKTTSGLECIELKPSP